MVVVVVVVVVVDVVVVVELVGGGGASVVVEGTTGIVGSLMRSAVPWVASPAPLSSAWIPAIDGTASSATSSAYSTRLTPRSPRRRHLGRGGGFGRIRRCVAMASLS